MPSFNGGPKHFQSYKYQVTIMKALCHERDYKYLAPRLIANFIGAMSEDVRAMELRSSDYMVGGGLNSCWHSSESAYIPPA